MQAYVLRGRSFWQLTPSQGCSWSWRKLFDLRTIALEFREWEGGIGRWKISGQKYKVSAVWRVIRPKKAKVEWHRLIWAPYIVPKYGFIAWMAILNRLPTMDRMQNWGIEVVGVCVLCKQEAETRDHLFFNCSYSEYIWKGLMQLGGIRRDVVSWEAELKWASKRLKGKALVTLILRCAWSACIYAIWKERNCRLNRDKEETKQKVLENIVQMIRLKFANLRNIEADHVNTDLIKSWRLPQNILA